MSIFAKRLIQYGDDKQNTSREDYGTDRTQ